MQTLQGAVSMLLSVRSFWTAVHSLVLVKALHAFHCIIALLLSISLLGTHPY